jgi:glycosyltransferase involved in cell wall biosynthesis
MKVLQVIPGTSTNFGGPSVALTDMSRLLCAKGIETSILTTNIDPAMGRMRVPLGVPTEQRGARVVYCNVWPRTRYAFSTSLARTLFQTAHLYDVIHIHWLYNFAPLAAAMAARRAKVPYVLQPNGSLDPNLMKKNRIFKKIYNSSIGKYIIENASGIIYTTQTEQRLASIPKDRIPSHIVPVGLDGEEYVRLPTRGRFRGQFPEFADKFIVLFLSRINHQKGLDLLIPAFRIVAAKHSRAHLVIAGSDGDGYGRQVRQWVGEAGLSNRVSFVGRVPDELKLAAYVDADLFVLPSYAENFGAVVTEALACRCPVVISNRVNICDEIAAAEAGIVTECTVASVADGMALVIESPDLARRLGQNGYDLVQRKFTWDVALEKMIPIYRELARGTAASVS